MLRAAVLSQPGSGATTFMGLLYSTLVRRSTEQSNEFRFSATPESLDLLTDLYEHLVTGEFPTDPSREASANLHLTLAFQRRPSDRNWFHREVDFASAPKVDLRWIRGESDDLWNAWSRTFASRRSDGRLTDVTAPIFIASTPPTEPGSDAPTTRSSCDTAFRSVLQQLARAAESSGPSQAERAHPIFVFTKFDQLPSQAMRRLGLNDLDDTAPEGVRRRAGAQFLSERLPLTAQYCGAVGPLLSPPEVFFSYVRLDATALPALRISTQTSTFHRREPVYGLAQFRALIDHLRYLSS